MMKAKILIFGVPVLLFVLFFSYGLSWAQDKAPEFYKDRNNFFTFGPPADWAKEEIAGDTVSQVNFKSPDGKAGMGVIAQLDEGELNGLFSQKKDYIKEFKRRFPKGRFVLSWDTLGERKVVKVDFEIPKLIKQEQYFFFDQGVRFDLVYGVANAGDFERYKKTALDALVTIQRQKQVKRGK
jgi:hypothetical protein